MRVYLKVRLYKFRYKNLLALMRKNLKSNNNKPLKLNKKIRKKIVNNWSLEIMIKNLSTFLE